MSPRQLALLPALLVAGCTCGGPGRVAGTTSEVERPNVLVVIWDTVRADRLSTYGYERPTTPRLDAYAQQGVVYERAVSPGMWTLPSHASLFTGLPVSAHGASSHRKWLDNRFVTMAEWFGEAGYDTYLFSANPYLQDHTNLGQGFDVREYPWSKDWKAKARRATMSKVLPEDASNPLGPRWKLSKYPSGRSNDKVKDAGPVAAEALFSWMDRRRDTGRPWLAVLNYMEAHSPRIPSLASRKALFDDDLVRRQLELDASYGFLLAYTVEKHDFSSDDLAVIESVYDATIRDLDEATAALFDELDRRGVLEDTIVVLTSDHGEHLGEHHMFGHKYSVYNPLVRVPLIIRYPKRLPPGRVDKVVSNLAVFATVAELAGLGMPEGTLSQSLLHLDRHDGQAFSELNHATPLALKRMEKVHPDLQWEPFLRTFTSVETGDAKCITASDGTRQLFEMPHDAAEASDLAPADPQRAVEVCARIDEWRRTFAPYDVRKAGPEDQPKKEMDRQTRRRLAALGYLEEAEDDEEDEEELE